jgi:hypothetical protein
MKAKLWHYGIFFGMVGLAMAGWLILSRKIKLVDKALYDTDVASSGENYWV